MPPDEKADAFALDPPYGPTPAPVCQPRYPTRGAVDHPAGGDRAGAMTGSATPRESNQLDFVNGPEVSTVSRPIQAAASWTFVMVTDFALTLNL